MNKARPQFPIIRLGSRQSPLAMAQAFEARRRLCAAHDWPEAAVEVITVKASGDKVLDRPLADIGGKALWTKELDEWLIEGRIDAAVHSMKDVETIRPAEFVIGAILPRADRRDVLIGAPSIDAIPEGAVVGTSAPRRAAQLLHYRPDCRIVTFRGNVATRLAKLEAGEADVTFLAAAGLVRLEQGEIGTVLSSGLWLPAAAQGAIGIECAAGNQDIIALIAAVDDYAGRVEVQADRALLRGLGGTCHSPVAVNSQYVDGQIIMTAALFSSDGAEKLADTVKFAAGDDGAAMGFARRLLDQAGPAIRQNFGQLE